MVDPPGSRFSGLDLASAACVIARETIGNPVEASPHFIKVLLEGFACEFIALSSSSPPKASVGSLTLRALF